LLIRDHSSGFPNTCWDTSYRLQLSETVRSSSFSLAMSCCNASICANLSLFVVPSSCNLLWKNLPSPRGPAATCDMCRERCIFPFIYCARYKTIALRWQSVVPARYPRALPAHYPRITRTLPAYWVSQNSLMALQEGLCVYIYFRDIRGTDLHYHGKVCTGLYRRFPVCTGLYRGGCPRPTQHQPGMVEPQEKPRYRRLCVAYEDV